MNSKEIFFKLRAGEISSKYAKKELIELLKNQKIISNQSSVNRSTGKQQFLKHPSSQFNIPMGNDNGFLQQENKESIKNKVIKEHIYEKNELLNNNQSIKLKPENLGSPIFQKRYNCKWNYFSGPMAYGISSEQLIIRMSKSNLLSFFGSAGLNIEELESHIQNIQSQISSDKPFGMCLIHNLSDPEGEMRHAELFLKYNIPLVIASAYLSLSEPLVYYRLKGIYRKGNRIITPRRIIGKCSRLEIARIFLSPPSIDIVSNLLRSGLINEAEAELSQYIPVADDIAVEADSGGHTDQGVAFTLIPSIISLKEKIKLHYNYQEEILIGYGGGIGTPEAVASAFMLGADFIFTGSINQCTVESGAHDVVKDILNTISIHDTGVTIALDMVEVGAKIQVVKKDSQYFSRANRLYNLFTYYNAIEEIPESIKQEIETQYFKKTFSEVWDLVCKNRNKKISEQIKEAEENPRLKTVLILKWYYAHCNEVTLKGEELEKDNFVIGCGPALGAFNQWVQGTEYEHWKNRHVNKIAELLLLKACEYIEKGRFFVNNLAVNTTVATDHNNNIPLDYKNSSIAIIGISGQFPKSKNLDEYWENLANGINCISEIPEIRWSVNKYYDPDPKVPGKTNCKWLGILEDVDKFDPLFFDIMPVEAKSMDPQQRLFLESCWSCIEDSGLNPASLSESRCGVFVGCGVSDYGQLTSELELEAHTLTGNTCSMLSARISYFLNLKGPCLSIETACSSSLVAIAEACNSLILNTCDLALGGGVQVMLGPSSLIMPSKVGMLSQDGRCFTFDKRANGFVPGEGVGVVLLKRLQDAICDRDHIYGVIRGWGINYDGKTNGITAPSVNSQIMLEKDVYQRFGINPETITLVEAHGTGTKLGDPIEIEALTETFQFFTDKKNYCALGSVKSNIGHLIKAAGMAQLIKVLLAIKNRMLPPTINFETLNEHISLENSPFYINTRLQPWEVPSGIARRAALSSFGLSGTNAHFVIEEFLTEVDTSKREILINKDNPIIFVLSAKTEEQLKIYTKNIKSFIESHEDISLTDIAYTLQIGRYAMNYRLGFVADYREALLKSLEDFINNESSVEVLTSQVMNNKDVRVIFEGDEDIKALLHTWVQKKKLKKIVELWVKGLDIDWDKLYDGVKPSRISLPTYPFARERYWLQESRTKNAIITTNSFIDSGMLTLSAENVIGLDEITNTVLNIITDITEYKSAKINLEQKLSELNLDSIILMKIANGLITSFKFLDSFDESTELLQLLTMKDPRIKQLIKYIKEKNELVVNSDYKCIENCEQDNWSLNEIILKQKKDSQNIICSDLRINSKSPYIISGKLKVDETHPFFFDHPLNHISGIQLAESMSELAKAGFIFLRKLDPQSLLFISEIDLEFNIYCKKDTDSYVKAVAVQQDENDNKLHLKTDVIQENKIISTGNYTIQECPLSQKILNYDQLNSPIKLLPCNKKLVNKKNEKNVLVSDIVTGDNIQDIGCYLFFQPDNKFFNDFRGEFIDTVILLEACRQSGRVFGSFLKDQKNFQFYFKGSIGIFKSIYINIKQPIYKTEIVFIKNESTDIIKIGDNQIIEAKGIIIIDGVKIGFFKKQSLLLTETLFSKLEQVKQRSNFA